MIILITGASGTDKTTFLQKIQKQLASQLVTIFHFDDIGVPSFEDMIKQYGSPENWQKEMTEQWIERLSQLQEPQLIFLEGSFNPEFAINALKNKNMHNYLLFCIHRNQEIRKQRLREQRL